MTSTHSPLPTRADEIRSICATAAKLGVEVDEAQEIAAATAPEALRARVLKEASDKALAANRAGWDLALSGANGPTPDDPQAEVPMDWQLALMRAGGQNGQ